MSSACEEMKRKVLPVQWELEIWSRENARGQKESSYERLENLEWETALMETSARKHRRG